MLLILAVFFINIKNKTKQNKTTKLTKQNELKCFIYIKIYKNDLFLIISNI